MPDIITTLIENYANLDSQRRKLLALLLEERGIDLEEKIILPQPRETLRFPLSFAQQRLWFLEQLEPNTALYNIPVAVRLRGKLDREALQRSLDALIARHESLRTTFSTDEGEPLQVVSPEATLAIQQVDLRDLPRAQQEQRVHRFAMEEAQKPFDLATGPLVRFRLIQLSETEYVALLTMHHIISDGWSMSIFISELTHFYDAFSRGGAPDLPPLKIQYPDFAVWQRKVLQGKRLEEQLAFWRQQFADGGSPPLALPLDYPRPPVTTFRGDHVHFEIPAPIAEKLVTLGQDVGATPFMTLLAAFYVLLYRYSGQDDISVGTPVAGRTRAELENLIGFFINTLVLRAQIQNDQSFQDFLRQVMNTAQAVFDHQELPFERIVEEIKPQRDLSRSPLFQTLFTFQNMPAGAIEVADLTFEPVDVTTGTVKFDLTLTVGGGPEGFNGVLGYNIDLFQRASIERMARHFLALLADIVSHPQSALSQLNLLPEDERQRILEDWAPDPTPFPANRLAHQLFEEAVERFPSRPAVIQPAAGDGSQRALTYAELNARANQLAHRLMALGVGPEDVVGISMGRSPEMLIAMLGILKAGGAYLPLDPNYPAERVRFMMEDAGVRIVISDQDSVDRLPSHAQRQKSDDGMAYDVLRITENELSDSPYPVTNPIRTASLENIAYIIYTSGTTGQPKGVLVEHRNVIRLFSSTDEWYHFSRDDVWTLFHSCTFDFSVWEIWGALFYGAKLIVVPYWVSRSPDDFYKLLRKNTVFTVTSLTFTMYVTCNKQDIFTKCCVKHSDVTDVQNVCHM